MEEVKELEQEVEEYGVQETVNEDAIHILNIEEGSVENVQYSNENTEQGE